MPSPTVSAVRDRSESDPKRGFASHGDFMSSVMKADRANDPSQVRDERLRKLAYEGSELGYAVPNGFVGAPMRAAVSSDEQAGYASQYGEVLQGVAKADALLARGFEGDPTQTQIVPMTAPTQEIPVLADGDHTTSFVGGITVTRKPETLSATASRGTMEMLTLKATTQMTVVYGTEELVADSPRTFSLLVDRGFAIQAGGKLFNEKMRGLGDSEFLGVINASCTISVSKESGQLADTIVAANVTKMRSRCFNYENAVWIANHDAYPQLAALSVGIGEAGLFQYSQRDGEPDRLAGRPIYFREVANTVGDVGDLVLGDWSQYIEGVLQPIQNASSTFVRFVNHEHAFKFWRRNAGQPWWRTPLTPTRSTTTLSPFVTLAARA